MKIQQNLMIVLLTSLLLISGIAGAKDYAKEYQEMYGIKVSNEFAQQAIARMSKEQSAPQIKTMPIASPIAESSVEPVKTTNYNPVAPTPPKTPGNQGNYSIQLLVTGSENKMKSFISKHNLGAGAWVEKANSNGKPLYKVMYGHYASRTEATRDIQSLPAPILQLKPWVKYIK